MSGTWITFEGGDGVGKSTQLQLAAEWLAGEGLEVVTTREPGGTALGVELRRLLQHTEDAVAERAEALLFAADRAQHIATLVRPALERGAVVLQDRYIDSSVAYQGAGRSLDPAEVRALSEWGTDGRYPDITVLLDLDPDAAAERRAGRDGGHDRMEAAGLDFHRRVREAYLEIAEREPARFLVLDAAQPAPQLQQQIRTRIEPLLAA